MAATDNTNQNLVVTAFWEVNPGEEGRDCRPSESFLPQAQQEPGVKELQIHQIMAEPRNSSFTKSSQARPHSPSISKPRTSRTSSSARRLKLAKRERSQFRFI